jgi:hypothetical protein
MNSNLQSATVSKKAFWAGWVISGLIVLLFGASGIMKIVRPPGFEKGFTEIEWPPEYSLGLGIVELVCAIVYAIPQTAVLGAVLLTGYLGGAIATHVRLGQGIVPHIVIGLAIWGGLYLRDTRLRALLPLRN